MSALLDAMLWVATSCVVLFVQYALVAYNAVVIAGELSTMSGLRLVRHLLRWVALPLPGRWAQKRALWSAVRRLHEAARYEDWLAAARELDELEGGREWRQTPESDEYDWALIEDTTRRLRHARRRRDVHSLLFHLSAVMDRSYGGIDRPALYAGSLLGTKALIEAYLAEVCACLDTVAEADAATMTDDAKLEFFEGCRLAMGRTALALSGGGALALAHGGVVRTLLQNGLLPRVLSGTSGGAIIAAMMALHTDEELLADVLVPSIIGRHGVAFFDPLHAQLRTFVDTTIRLGSPQIMDGARFAAALRAYYGDATFLSAYGRTGRIVNISVSAMSSSGTGGGHARPLVLNYLTSPHVLLWSAVAASCALPGLMRPATLMALNHAGEAVPFLLPGVNTLDGSMSADLPLAQLTHMFHAQRLIVSQANPHVTPFVQLKHGARGAAAVDRSLLSRGIRAVEHFLALDVRQRTKYLARARLIPKWFGTELSTLVLQKYSSDHITILPSSGVMSVWRALSQPTEADMRHFLLVGQRATWPHLAAIRSQVAVEKTLSRLARRFMPAGGGGGGSARRGGSSSAKLYRQPRPMPPPTVPPVQSFARVGSPGPQALVSPPPLSAAAPASSTHGRRAAQHKAPPPPHPMDAPVGSGGGMFVDGTGGSAASPEQPPAHAAATGGSRPPASPVRPQGQPSPRRPAAAPPQQPPGPPGSLLDRAAAAVAAAEATLAATTPATGSALLRRVRSGSSGSGSSGALPDAAAQPADSSSQQEVSPGGDGAAAAPPAVSPLRPIRAMRPVRSGAFYRGDEANTRSFASMGSSPAGATTSGGAAGDDGDGGGDADGSPRADTSPVADLPPPSPGRQLLFDAGTPPSPPSLPQHAASGGGDADGVGLALPPQMEGGSVDDRDVGMPWDALGGGGGGATFAHGAHVDDAAAAAASGFEAASPRSSHGGKGAQPAPVRWPLLPYLQQQQAAAAAAAAAAASVGAGMPPSTLPQPATGYVNLFSGSSGYGDSRDSRSTATSSLNADGDDHRAGGSGGASEARSDDGEPVPSLQERLLQALRQHHQQEPPPPRAAPFVPSSVPPGAATPTLPLPPSAPQTADSTPPSTARSLTGVALVSALKGSRSSPSLTVGADLLPPPATAAPAGGKTVTFHEAALALAVETATDDSSSDLHGGADFTPLHSPAHSAATALPPGVGTAAAALLSPAAAAQQWLQRYRVQPPDSDDSSTPTPHQPGYDGAGLGDDGDASSISDGGDHHPSAVLGSGAATAPLDDIARRVRAARAAADAAAAAARAAAPHRAAGGRAPLAHAQMDLAIATPSTLHRHDQHLQGGGGRSALRAAAGAGDGAALPGSPGQGPPLRTGILTPLPTSGAYAVVGGRGGGGGTPDYPAGLSSTGDSDATPTPYGYDAGALPHQQEHLARDSSSNSDGSSDGGAVVSRPPGPQVASSAGAGEHAAAGGSRRSDLLRRYPWLATPDGGARSPVTPPPPPAALAGAPLLLLSPPLAPPAALNTTTATALLLQQQLAHLEPGQQWPLMPDWSPSNVGGGGSGGGQRRAVDAFRDVPSSSDDDGRHHPRAFSQ